MKTTNYFTKYGAANIGDDTIDYPTEDNCTCGLAPSESVLQPPIYELPTIVLLSIGLLVLTGYVLRVAAKT